MPEEQDVQWCVRVGSKTHIESSHQHEAERPHLLLTLEATFLDGKVAKDLPGFESGPQQKHGALDQPLM